MGNLTTALGQRIKELRKAKKLTQAQLSEAIGMHLESEEYDTLKSHLFLRFRLKICLISTT